MMENKMETPIEKKQRLEHRDEGMEEMPMINYDMPCDVDHNYIQRVIESLEADIQSFNGPGYTGNPHMTGVRVALQSVVAALRIGLMRR